MDNILKISLTEELDDGVLMAQDISGETLWENFHYHIDYEHPTAFSIDDFVSLLELGMHLGKEGYNRVELERK